MYKKLLLLPVIASTVAFGAHVQEGALHEKPFSGNDRPARSIRIGKADQFVWTNGAAKLEIVVTPGAVKAVRHAAEELKHYLQRRLNVQIPIVPAPTGKASALIPGDNALSRNAGIDAKKLCRDGFVIKSVGNAIYIVGRDEAASDPVTTYRTRGFWGHTQQHSTLLGVYDFLERFGGIRFYFPDEKYGVYIPKGTMRVPEINLFDRPDYETRQVSIYNGIDVDGKFGKPFETHLSENKNRQYDRLRLQSKYIPNCHGLRDTALIERFAKTHPEYFALRSDGRRYHEPDMPHTGQLCYSSKVIDEIEKTAISIVKNEHPSKVGSNQKSWSPAAHLPGLIFGMMPQDGFQFCVCPECRKNQKDLQATSNHMWSLTARVARAVQKAAPGKYVSQMAYYPYSHVPDVDLPDNILVMVATKGPWQIRQREKQSADLKLIRDWNQKINSRVWLWNYVGKFGNLNMPGVPAVTPRSIGKYYGSLKNDIFGSYMESESDKWLYNYLNFYVYGKVHWDNNTDIEKLLDEHDKLMFGAAAPAMKAVFLRFEDLWVDRIGGRTVETVLGPMGAPPSENELWNDVYDAKTIAVFVADFDRAEKLAASDPEALARVRYIRKEFLDPLLAARSAYAAHNDTIRSFAENLPATFYLKPFQGKDELKLKTKVQVSLDDKFLTVKFDCDEPNTGAAYAPKRALDDKDMWRDNNVEVFLDPAGTRKGFYQLIVNSAGSLTDLRCTALGSNTQTDHRWNSHAEVRTTPTAKGFAVEIRIPRASLGTINPEGMVANFTRNRSVKGTQQYYSWSPFLKEKFHELERFGTLIPKKSASRNILKHSDFDCAAHRFGFGAWVSLDTTSGTQAALDDRVFVFGPQSLRLSNTNKDKKFLFVVTQGVQKIKPNTRYRLSFFVKLDNVKPLAPSGGICLNVFNAKNFWFPANKLVGTSDWFKQSFEFTSALNSNPKATYLKPVMYFCTGTVWFDRIMLEEL